MKDFDRIELEIFKNVFVSIAEEMGVVLGRTALSPNIKERRDFSCAIFNRRGETFAQGSHIPVHLGAMPLSVRSALAGVDLCDGDTVMLNDPYRGGTHLPDITCISPVFIRGRLEFLVANRAHHADIGGMAPGSMPLATTIFQEGLIIPPLKIISRGRMNEDLLRLIFANVRMAGEREGDLRAQVAANETGRRRLLEVVRTHGLAKIKSRGGHIQAYTEKILRRLIASIPDGKHYFQDCLDDDGVSDAPVRIAVELTIDGDSALVDFSRSAPQVEGNVNANYAVTLSAVLYVFRSLIREDIPFNTGLLGPLRIIAPEGSVVNASFPAAVAGGNVETSQRIVDVLLGALSLAVPDRIPAASSGTMNNVAFGSSGAADAAGFAYYETIGGGMGASRERDGLSGVHTHMTNSLNTPVEALEAYMPVKIGRYRLRKNSGGKGKHAGGDGIVREYEFEAPADVTIISDRRTFRPYGLQGGMPGKKGSNTLIRDGKKIRLKSKVNLKVKPGDRLVIETPGGGGYGKKKKNEQ